MIELEQCCDEDFQIETVETCRFCLNQGNLMRDIFVMKKVSSVDEIHYDSIQSMIDYSICVSIKKQDKFPSTICYECFDLLKNACLLKIMCLRSEKSNTKVENESAMSKTDGNNDLAAAECSLESNEFDMNYPISMDTNDLSSPIQENSSTELQAELLKSGLIAGIDMQCASCKYKCRSVELMTKHRKKMKHFKNVCHICGATLATFSALQLHIQAHLPPQNFCSQCDYSTSNVYDLTKHKRIHSGEKLYSCPRCSKTFADASNFRKHMQRHISLKDFTCLICDKRYRDEEVILSHLDSHFFIKRHTCGLCEARYQYRPDLVNHMKKVHKTLPKKRGTVKKLQIVEDNNIKKVICDEKSSLHNEPC